MFGEAWSPMSVPDLAPDDDDDLSSATSKPAFPSIYDFYPCTYHLDTANSMHNLHSVKFGIFSTWNSIDSPFYCPNSLFFGNFEHSYIQPKALYLLGVYTFESVI